MRALLQEPGSMHAGCDTMRNVDAYSGVGVGVGGVGVGWCVDVSPVERYRIP